MFPEMPTITRFAPSPTGPLHLGSAYSALFAERAAREAGGYFLIRIEDIDTTRCRPEHEAAILEDLAWLGLTWPEPVRRQSAHFERYEDCVHTLEEGGLAYPCFCTRADIRREIEDAPSAPHGPDGPLYPGTCKGLSPAEASARIAAGESHAIRLDMEKAARIAGPLTFTDRVRGKIDVRPETCGDIVVARKDTPTSYHVSVVIDDGLQGVSLVTRGEDLLHATHVQRILQSLFGLPEPEYHHHPLILDTDGKRLAKRDRSTSIRSLRDDGKSADDVRAMIAELAP